MRNHTESFTADSPDQPPHPVESPDSVSKSVLIYATLLALAGCSESDLTRAPLPPPPSPSDNILMGTDDGIGLPGWGDAFGDVSCEDRFTVRYSSPGDEELFHSGIADEVSIDGQIFVVTDGFNSIDLEGLYRFPESHLATDEAMPVLTGARGYQLNGYPKTSHLSLVTSDLQGSDHAFILETDGDIVADFSTNDVVDFIECETSPETRIVGATEADEGLIVLVAQACPGNDILHNAMFELGVVGSDNTLTLLQTGTALTTMDDFTQGLPPRDMGLALTENLLLQSSAISGDDPLKSAWSVVAHDIRTNEDHPLISGEMDTPDIFVDDGRSFGVPITGFEQIDSFNGNIQLTVVTAQDGDNFPEHVTATAFRVDQNGVFYPRLSAEMSAELGPFGLSALSMPYAGLPTTQVGSGMEDVLSNLGVNFPIHTWMIDSTFGDSTSNGFIVSPDAQIEPSAIGAFSVDDRLYRTTGTFASMTGLLDSRAYFSGVPVDGSSQESSVVFQCTLGF